MNRRDFGKMALIAAGGLLAGTASVSAKSSDLSQKWGAEGCPGSSCKSKDKGKGGCGCKKGECNCKGKKPEEKKPAEKKPADKPAEETKK